VTEAERLAVLAHEVRSPVAARQAIEQTMRAAGSALDGDERERMLLVAVAACRDLERLLGDPDLLSISGETVDLAALLHGFGAERVTVATEPDLFVAGDPVRLRQVVANLVANGLRHGTLVSVAAAVEGAEVHVTVSDEGPGVDPSLDLFARGVSGAGSTGLGLHVAREIAGAHGGTLELVPSPGAGATFRLALPRASAAQA